MNISNAKDATLIMFIYTIKLAFYIYFLQIVGEKIRNFILDGTSEVKNLLIKSTISHCRIPNVSLIFDYTVSMPIKHHILIFQLNFIHFV